MKTLAAASIYSYERAILSMNNYNRTIDLGLQAIFHNQEFIPDIAGGESPRTGVVIFGSDRGLCGRFNEDIVTFSLDHLDNEGVAQENRLLLSVGSRLEPILQAANQKVHESFFIPGSVSGTTSTVESITDTIEDWRNEYNIDSVYLFHNTHSGGRERSQIYHHLLPMDFKRYQRTPSSSWPSRSLPTYSMDWNKLLYSLIRQHLFISIFRACAFSLASENSSRLQSMQAAERNINETLSELQGDYSRKRQESITSEILEVSTGYSVISSAADNN
jgi:F-type H+-transporting ATPase subunit gamma